MKLLIAVGAAALLTAACSASGSVSGTGSGTSAAKTANTLHITSGANAGTDALGDPAVNRVNPPAGKPGTRPVSPAPVFGVAPAQIPGAVSQDRCGSTGGAGINGPAPRTGIGSSGKRPPLPMCAVQ